MALIVKKKSGKQGLLGIWELDGSEAEHQQSRNLTASDQKVLDTFHFSKKKQQWLAVRILLEELTGKNDLRIIYDEFNKPSLADNSTNISISHSHDKVVILLQPDEPTGVDIELIGPKVERIASKFMSEKEMCTLSD